MLDLGRLPKYINLKGEMTEIFRSGKEGINMKKALKILFWPFLIPVYILMLPVILAWSVLKFAVFLILGCIFLDALFGIIGS